jgi:LacI family transcriptional regulator
MAFREQSYVDMRNVDTMTELGQNDKPNASSSENERAEMSGAKIVCAAVPVLSRSHQDQLRGVFEYARKVGWRVDVFDHGAYTQALSQSELLRGCDGLVIGDLVEFVELPAWAKRKPLVLIDCSPALSQRYPSVLNDNAAIGRLAAKTLFSRRFAAYAFFPQEGSHIHEEDDWSDRRGRAFAEAVTRMGGRFAGEPPPASEAPEAARKRAAAWLETLPKPVAIFAANDKFARICADAAMILELKVPDDVAILGVDDDDLVCETAAPELSSILVDFQACGYKAAKLLDHVMKGNVRTPAIERFGPLDVRRRASTREPAGKTNWRYVQALDFINRRAKDGIRVGDVAAELGMSIRSVNYLFAAADTTVSKAITEAKLAAARASLLATRKSIARIAAECGFVSAAYFTRVFVRRFGVTPSDCRCAKRQ